jgi:hypothetical protein
LLVALEITLVQAGCLYAGGLTGTRPANSHAVAG